MKMNNTWNLKDIDDIITTTVNSILVPLKTKEQLQKVLIEMVCCSCKTYEKDKDFKNKIDFICDNYVNNKEM